MYKGICETGSGGMVHVVGAVLEGIELKVKTGSDRRTRCPLHGRSVRTCVSQGEEARNRNMVTLELV